MASGDKQGITTITDRADKVAAGCPLCDWESEEIVVRDEPNGEWLAFSPLAAEFRSHFDWHHRPPPVRIRRWDENGRSDG